MSLDTRVSRIERSLKAPPRPECPFAPNDPRYLLEVARAIGFAGALARRGVEAGYASPAAANYLAWYTGFLTATP